jgi:peptidyl-tRNA hydrolase
MSDQAPDDVRLYILMRTDMASMNPGKAVAQGAHAANLAIRDMRVFASMDADDEQMLAEWEGQAHGFGTTITLGVDGRTLNEIIDVAADELDLCSGVVLDPTYPLRDGQVTHLIPLVTCGYILTRRSYLNGLLDNLTLMA